MPGLVPGIHVLVSIRQEDVDGRDKPGHDEKRIIFRQQLGNARKCWPLFRSGPEGILGIATRRQTFAAAKRRAPRRDKVPRMLQPGLLTFRVALTPPVTSDHPL
jgi:hypothetical protein